MTKATIGFAAAGAAYVAVQRFRHVNVTAREHDRGIHGFVTSGFKAVRAAFVENFEKRGEVGATCCVYHEGEKVVDLWGGIRDKETGEPGFLEMVRADLNS